MANYACRVTTAAYLTRLINRAVLRPQLAELLQTGSVKVIVTAPTGRIAFRASGGSMPAALEALKTMPGWVDIESDQPLSLTLFVALREWLSKQRKTNSNLITTDVTYEKDQTIVGDWSDFEHIAIDRIRQVVEGTLVNDDLPSSQGAHVMKVLVKRFGELAVFTGRRNGPDLEVTVRARPPLTTEQLQTITADFARRMRLSPSEFTFVDYESAHTILRATYTELSPLVVKATTEGVAQSVSAKVTARTLDTGSRLVDNCWLAPSGRKVLFPSTLRSGRAVSNLYAAETAFGHLIQLTQGAACSFADSSIDDQTIGFVTGHWSDQDLIIREGSNEPWIVDFKPFALQVRSMSLGTKYAFCKVLPDKFSRVGTPLTDSESWFAIEPATRTLVDLQVSPAATIGRGSDRCVIIGPGGLEVYDVANRARRKIKTPKPFASPTDVRLDQIGNVFVLRHERESPVFTLIDVASPKQVTFLLDRSGQVGDWAVSGSSSTVIYTTATKARRGNNIAVEMLDLRSGIHRVLADGGTFRFPQISDDGKVFCWLQLSSDRASYGQIIIAGRVE